MKYRRKIKHIMLKLFNNWNVIDYCPKCKSKETVENVLDTLDGHLILEEEISCAKCGQVLDYYAYGYSAVLDKRTDQIKFIWQDNSAPMGVRIKRSLSVIFKAQLLFLC